MSDIRSGVYLQPLSKEDLKNLAKQQQKAKRDEEAKTAKTRPQTIEAPMGSSGLFSAPVKVSNRDGDKDNRKLMDILGPYDRMSHAIMSGRTRDLMGVEQQPATPLPSKNAPNAPASFFDRNKHAGKNSAKDLYNSRLSEGTNQGKDPPVFSRPDKKGSTSDSNPLVTKEHSSKYKRSVTTGRSVPTSQTSMSSTATEKPNRSDQRENGSSSSTSSQNSSSSHKVSKAEPSNQNSKKEISDLSGKPGSEDRVPVLQSLNKELIGHSKKDSNQSVSGVSKISPSQQSTLRGGERTHKKPNPDPVTVLQESKEENRNAFNGKFKNKPRLHIPQEKNVEEMLQELTHMPQPLTGIQTPFKDSKFPFQEKVSETFSVRDVGLQNRSNMISTLGKVESKRPVVEEIQENDDTESSDSGGDDSGAEDCGNDDDGDDDDGSSSSSSGSDQEEEGECKSDNEKENQTDRKTQQVQPVQTPVEKIPVSASVNPGRAQPPVKEQRPMSSSDSSSSGSESSDSGSDSESVSEMSDNEKPDSLSPDKEKVTPPKMKATPEYMDTTPSPSRQSWNLGAFLPLPSASSGPLNMNTKPMSIEAPPSDKSDPDQFDEVIGVKRSADHVSDENPQSVDQEGVSKPMSADEFSPPASTLDKEMLSPIKSPQSVKSPTKRTVNLSSVTEKPHIDHISAKTKPEAPVVYNDRYDSIKKRERNKSMSISSPDVSKEPIKQKQSRMRKQKQRVFTPSVVPDDTSSSDSDIDMDIQGSSLSKSPRKSMTSILNDTYKTSSLPSRSSSSSPKKKESKREKLLKEQNSVKLKKGNSMQFNPSDCDNSAKEVSAHTDYLEKDSMKQIFNYFTGEKPLSPIPCDPKFENVSESLKTIKSEILPVRNHFNGSVKYSNGKPSVLVQIELNLLHKMMVKDKTDPNVLRIKPEMAKKFKDDSFSNKGHIKRSKVTSAKNYGTDITNKSHKVLESEPEVTNVSTASNHSASFSQTSANSASTISANSKERNYSESVSKPKVSQKEVLNHSKASDDMPDFDSLPVRKLVDKLSEGSVSDSGSSSSNSSDSELEDDSKSSQRDVSVSSHPVSFNQSPPDKKKRKIDSHRADDSKRRKTSSSKVLNKQTTPDRASQKSHHDLTCEPNQDDVTENESSNRKSTAKRERCSSTSSQQSTLSQHSTQSNRSTSHSRHNAHSQKGHKKAKLSDPPQSDLISNHSAKSATQSHVKSSPTALSTSSSKHGKTEFSESTKVNGHIPQQSSIVPHPESDHRARGNSHGSVSSSHDLELEDRPLSGTEYHKKATIYKHKADAMPTVPHSLDKYIVFLESVLYFLLSGVAREREHQTMEASSLFKDTHRLMVHHYHQFRLNQESDTADKSDIKFTVLCLRIQSLLYYKLYKLKRTENMKLKKVLDDHHNKSVKTTSQPKPPSAPSPHQTNWNRSTGTPSPMSPTPSPANSVCSVGSVGSDQTPSKMTNGTSNTGATPIAPPGSVLVPQRIHSITQKYFTTTNYLIQAHELWDQADGSISAVEVKDFIKKLDAECGPLTIHSSLQHLVKYCRKGLTFLKAK